MPESKIRNSTFGNYQLGYFDDGAVAIECGRRIAMGVIDLSTTPSTVYSFGYPDSLTVLGKLVGENGVTHASRVINNTSRKTIGTIEELI
jgi:hypothetical protein